MTKEVSEKGVTDRQKKKHLQICAQKKRNETSQITVQQ